MTLPETTTPEALAKHLGWSERRVRSEAKRLGACRILGNRMALTKDDVQVILEATKCPSSSMLAAKSGTIGVRLPGGGYEDLVRQRKKPSRHYGSPIDRQFVELAAEVRRADALPAEGVRTTRAGLAMVTVLEEFFAGDRELTSQMLMLAGATLPWLRGEAWTARKNEKGVG